MKFEEILINSSPKSLRLPIKYLYNKFRNRLEKEIFYLDNLVGSRKRAIDIGANQGIYSYALSQLCDVVEVFEPQTWCTEDIVSYSRVSSCKINVHNVGIASFNGSLTLHIPTSKGNYSKLVSGLGSLTTGLASFKDIEGEQTSINVPVHKLDDYEFQDVSFIKIDVEGYEAKVIEGGTKTILREKPIILIEIEQRHLEGKSINEVFNQIAELGYEGSFFWENQLRPISEFSYEINQEPFISQLTSVNYVNNFIFKPVSENKV